MDEMPVESRQKPPARQKVHRLGMVLFVAYVAMYVGFMGLVLAWPEALSWRPVAGVNLAILSGLGLIVAAIILAVIFMLAGTTEDDHAA
ncbi:DUF485 domain-containing protein [bacterium]|jgi:uncharacterized membrane protein (DUF485 family)|nr:DUF485 domain-containing protein [Pirellulales bacterium]NBP80539.1 DUF485 domain-containing protein [bacterium]